MLTHICDLLYEKQYTNADFKDCIYRRENAATTAFGNIAIPHSVEMNAVKTCISVLISRKGITWGTNTVHLVFLLAINKADRKTFRELYESLITIFSNQAILQEVKNCISFDQFRALIFQSIQSE